MDSSAIVKLVRREDESDALIAALGERPQRASSEIAQVEVLRATRREDEGLLPRAQRVIADLGLIRVDSGQLARAAGIGPPALRTLDALHVAAAESLAEDLDVLIAYDQRLLRAAADLGLPTIAPE